MTRNVMVSSTDEAICAEVIQSSLDGSLLSDKDDADEEHDNTCTKVIVVLATFTKFLDETMAMCYELQDQIMHYAIQHTVEL